jgi:hypothetical protein
MNQHRSRTRSILSAMAVLGGLGAGTACDGDDLGASPEDTGGPDNTLRIVQRDYAFEVTGELTAGDVTIQVENRGRQMHELAMVRLQEGRTLDDVRAALARGSDDESPLASVAAETDGPIDDLGGVQFPGTSYAISGSDVPAGEYAVVCFIPAPDGRPHADHGMVAGFTVANGDVELGQQPDVTLTITDDGLEGPSTLPAGRTRIAVANESSTSREIGLARLAEGQDLDDMVDFFEETGDELPDVASSPFAMFGFAYDAVQDRILTVDLEPGRWVISTQDPENPSTQHPADDLYTVVIDVE